MTSDQDVTTEQTANKNYILYGLVQSILKKDLSAQHMCMCTKSVTYSYKGSNGAQEGDCCWTFWIIEAWSKPYYWRWILNYCLWSSNEMSDFSLPYHPNRSPKIKLMSQNFSRIPNWSHSLTTRVWCIMSLSVSDKRIYCFFHQSSEALEIPFNRNMETNGFFTMAMCPVTGPLQSGGSCSK